VALEHPSYPGYFGIALPAGTLARLEAVADAMIPGGDGYPSASEAEVGRFVSDHVAPGELEFLERLLGEVEPGAAHAWLRRLEQERAEDFAALRGWVYKAYYCAPATLQALRRRGSDYHGAPQPWGYELAAYEQLPAVRRGSYAATAEVRRAGS
jgi:hypothetical protein